MAAAVRRVWAVSLLVWATLVGGGCVRYRASGAAGLVVGRRVEVVFEPAVSLVLAPGTAPVPLLRLTGTIHEVSADSVWIRPRAVHPAPDARARSVAGEGNAVEYAPEFAWPVVVARADSRATFREGRLSTWRTSTLAVGVILALCLALVAAVGVPKPSP